MAAPLIRRRSFLGALGTAVSGAVVPPAWAASPRDEWRRLCPVTIDFHAHFLDERTLDVAEAHSPVTDFGRKTPVPRNSPLRKKMLDPSLHVEDMDSYGIDRSVISSSTVVQGLWFAEGDQARTLNRHVNDVAAEWVSRYPRRFIGSFCLPLGDVSDSLAELERALSNGLRVANLPAQDNGEYLGSRRFEPLWTAIEEKGVVAFVHPDGVRDRWYQPYWMWNSIGQSIEEVRVMTSLIYEGVLERHPGLKIVMAHGGGYMPHYMGRLDRNAKNAPESMANISQKPSAYLRRFHYDSIVYDPETLSALIAKVGSDRVVLGADYPVAGLDPVKFLENIPGLPAADIATVAGNNAAKLLGV
jgi:aminocarboxymuconate-semialdehyde decarboxylase